jgi:hypothetical protein
MLPDPEHARVRAALIKEAHIAILKEELPAPNRLELSRLMTDALVRASAGESIPNAIDQVLAQTIGDAPLRKRLQTVMFAALEDQELLTFMKDGYEINRKLEPKPLLRVLSRSTQVIGHIFEDIANQNSLDGKSLAWIARLGQMFWGLVEVAVPNSLLNMLIFHWLRVLYVFEVLLILGSFLLGAKDTLRFALTALGVTASVNVIVLLLRDRMRLKNGWLYLFTTLFISAILLLAGIGADDLFKLGVRDKLSEYLHEIIGR